MRHGSLFSGIGGFDLAAEWMGWENVFHCEINKFCQKVLKHYWPNAKLYEDITKTDFSEWRGKINIVTGGFPCQPYSTAGKRKGKGDDRHLWPEMLRAIREIQPTWVVGENVPGLLNWQRGMVLAEIKADLEAAGFEVFPPVILPACGKNAPHRRDRLWIVAYSKGKRGNGRKRNICEENGRQNGELLSECIKPSNRLCEKRIITDTGFVGQAQPEEQTMGNNELSESGIVAHSHGNGRKQHNSIEKNNSGQLQEGVEKRYVVVPLHGNWIAADITEQRLEGRTRTIIQGQSNGFTRNNWSGFPAQSPVLRGDDGIPNRVDRIKALGNAIVPQIAYEIFKAIEEVNEVL